MSDALSFWMDNKMVAGHKLVEIGDQALVDYRGKFYIVRNGSAVMSGSRPKHFSKTSLPPLWKKALKGELPVEPPQKENTAPEPKITRPARTRKARETVTMTEIPVEQKPAPPAKSPKQVKKPESKPAAQSVVPANCPYCNHRNDIPVEKGKNGKPFFTVCLKCSTDFAVRFVPVTMFQAQVAGFK